MGYEQMVAGLGELDAIHRHLDQVDLDGMARVVEWLREPDDDSDITPEFATFMEALTGVSVEEILDRFERMVTAAQGFKAVLDEERS